MSKPIVLVLDDDEDNATVLEVALQSGGFDVQTAGSLAEARPLLATGRIDALVSDFSLGDGDAFELMAELGPRRPRAAVLVTGYDSAEDQARSRAAGFDAHLVKPIGFAELERALRRVLDAKLGEGRAPEDA